MVKFNVGVLALASLGLLGAAAPVAAEESVTVKEMDAVNPVHESEEPSNKRKLWMLATSVAHSPSTLWSAPAGAEERNLWGYNCNTMWSCVGNNGFLKPSCGISATAFLVKVIQCWYGGGWRRTLRGSDEDLATPVSEAKVEEHSKKRKLWIFATNVAKNPSTLWRAPESAAESGSERKLFGNSCGYLWSCLDSNWMLKSSCGMTATSWLVQIMMCW